MPRLISYWSIEPVLSAPPLPGAGAGLAQLVPEVEPGGNVVGREGRLAFRRVEQLAALVQPVLEALLPAAVVAGAPVLALVDLRDLGGDAGHLVPGEVRVDRLDADLLEHADVVDHRLRVDAHGDAIELAVDHAGVAGAGGEAGHVDRLLAVERQQRPAPRIFVDVAVIHLDQVRRIAAGGLRRELGPVVAPAEGFRTDLHIRVLRLIGVERRARAPVALRVAPPVGAEPRAGLRPGRMAGRGERGCAQSERAESPATDRLHPRPPLRIRIPVPHGSGHVSCRRRILHSGSDHATLARRFTQRPFLSKDVLKPIVACPVPVRPAFPISPVAPNRRPVRRLPGHT